MKRVLSLAFVVALIVPFIAQAQAKPDFSVVGPSTRRRRSAPAVVAAAVVAAVADGWSCRNQTDGHGYHDRHEHRKLDGSAVEIQAVARIEGHGEVGRRQLVITTTGEIQDSVHADANRSLSATEGNDRRGHWRSWSDEAGLHQGNVRNVGGRPAVACVRAPLSTGCRGARRSTF